MELTKPASQRLRIGIIFVVTAVAALLPERTASAELHSRNPDDIMAGYLQNFPAYVEWPTNTFAGPEEPWRIGILGINPFGELLENNLRGQTIRGRPLEIWHAAKLSSLPPCEIIFIAGKDADELKRILHELGSRPVLTVSKHNDFLTLGGMIQLRGRDPVQILIDLDHVHAADLNVPGKLLEVASEVIENGRLRTIRK
jgi:hypothetical protein